MTRPRREITSEDLKLWRHVTRNASAYHASHIDEVAEAIEAPARAPTPRAGVPPPPRGSKPSPLSVGRVADLDRRQARRLKRGELPVDGRLDLHGLTLERAHAVLSGFIQRSHSAGARLVVVVTGKGNLGMGRIRSEAPHWLNSPDLRPLIVAVTHARDRDGGSGALYILLKRRRATE